MSTFTATPLPDLAAVRLEVAGAAAGALPITRTDRNGAHLVRQLPGQETSAGLLVVVDYEAALEGDVRYDLEAPRTNLCTNGGFEAGTTTGWAAYSGTGTTLTASAGAAYSGAYGLEATANGTTAAPRVWWSVPGIVPGDRLTASARVRKVGATWSAGAYPSLLLRGPKVGGGEWLANSVDAVTGPADANGWALCTVTATVPPEHTGNVQFTAGVYNVTGNPPAGALYQVDEVLIERADQVLPYLEGTDPAWPFTRTVTLGGAPAPIVTLPVRPQDRSSVKALEDYDEASQSPTVRHNILGGGTVANLRPLLAKTGTLTLRAATYEEAAHVRDVLSAAEVALFRQPTFAGLDLYFTVDGVRVAPTSDTGDQEWRVAVAFAQAEAPAGDLLGAAGWTIDDLVALGVTIADVPALFSTVYRLAVGPT